MSATGLRMPAEFSRHERTLIAWPCREEAWRGVGIDAARECHASVVDAISQFEPVTLAVNPEDSDAAVRACPEGNVTVAEIAMDDSWLRDSGPIIVRSGEGGRVGIDFRFNGWGGRFPSWSLDDAVSARLLELLGIERLESGIVLEGGSITVDGGGLIATTRQCNLNPNRNRDATEAVISGAFDELLGATETIWLERGLLEDADTDGHVDNVCAFTAARRAIVQTAPQDDPNHGLLAENLAVLEEAGVDAIPIELLPRTNRPTTGDPVVVPYTNFYICNGAVIVPVAGLDADMDEEALALIGAEFPDREVVGVEALALAFGGGGIHCITQQVPA